MTVPSYSDGGGITLRDHQDLPDFFELRQQRYAESEP